MIVIEERLSNKVVGKTALFISFTYDPQLVSLMHECDGAYYDTKAKTWEVPNSNLKKIISTARELDSISLKLLNTKESTVTNSSHQLLEYKVKPFAHQIEAIQYGLNHDSWLLLDAPGLGKSASMIHLAEELKAQSKIKHCLIICGINTLKFNWKKEIAFHSNLSARILGEKVNKNGHLVIGSVQDRLDQLKHPIDEFFVITNIETIRNNDIAKELNSSKVNKFDMVVVDEIHTCKSPTSQQGKNLLKLKSPKYKIALTGTLLLNSPLDAYMPLKWIGAEKANYTNFKYYFCNFSGPFNNILSGYKNISTLKSILNDCSLRRTKDSLDLPPKTIINEFVEMSSTQESFYKNIVNGIVDQVDRVHMSTTSLLAMVSRLRQATACPQYLTTENITSSKCDRAVDLATQIIAGGNKVVIFSVFKETLNYLNEKLKQYNPLICTGDISDDVISQNIDQFQGDEVHQIILATTSKMGTGITLTRASYAIFIDAPWTQALCQQCEDRIHRLGSKDPVFIYYLWTRDTIDERVKDIVETKGLISDYIIDDKCNDVLINKLRQIIVDL